MSCPSGYFLNAALGRCFETCRPGYTNNGEFCGRGAETRATSAMTCPPGCFLDQGLGRCCKNCAGGYTNTGEFRHRVVSALGLSSMRCEPGEFFKFGRRHKNDTCGANGEMDDIGLCYPICSPGFYGAGPVCWSACEAELSTACASGCVSSSAECGLAAVEMVAIIDTLGGYSSAKSSRRVTMIATAQTTKTAVKQGEKSAGKATLTRLDDILAAAAKITGGEASEAVARNMTRQFARNAKRGVAAAKRSVRYTKTRYVEVRRKIADKVFAPVAAKAKLAAETGWTKPKTRVTDKEDIAPIDQWWKLLEVDPTSLKTRAKAIYARMQRARDDVARNRLLRKKTLARSCGKLGVTITEKAT